MRFSTRCALESFDLPEQQKRRFFESRRRAGRRGV
jgi:hypothetical protein